MTNRTSSSVIGVYGKSIYTSIKDELVLVVFYWFCNAFDYGKFLKWT